VSANTARAHLRKNLSMQTGSGLQGHHIIPWQLRDNALVQKAAKANFNIHGKRNGIALGTNVHNGSHPEYNAQVLAYLQNMNAKFPNMTNQDAYNLLSTHMCSLRSQLASMTTKLP
jgi:hypothetical protein